MTKLYTAEEIHEENEKYIYCIICDDYIDNCDCMSCEMAAREHGAIPVGFADEEE